MLTRRCNIAFCSDQGQCKEELGTYQTWRSRPWPRLMIDYLWAAFIDVIYWTGNVYRWDRLSGAEDYEDNLETTSKSFAQTLIVIWVILSIWSFRYEETKIETLRTKPPRHYGPQNHYQHHCHKASTKLLWPCFKKSRRDLQRVQRLNPVLYGSTALPVQIPLSNPLSQSKSIKGGHSQSDTSILEAAR